jgi:hypothetical protein
MIFFLPKFYFILLSLLRLSRTLFHAFDPKSLMVEESHARPAGEGSVLEETHRPFLRRRVDYRKDHPAWFYHYYCYPSESVEERDSRLGFGDPDLVRTVFVRRRDGIIRELSTVYDSRYVEYDGALTPRHPSVLARINKDAFDQSPVLYPSSSTDSSGRQQSLRSPFCEESRGDITLFPSLFSFISQGDDRKKAAEVSENTPQIIPFVEKTPTIALRQLIPCDDISSPVSAK